jgi:hypothetical protein
MAETKTPIKEAEMMTPEQEAYREYKQADAAFQNAQRAVADFVKTYPDCRLPGAVMRHPELAQLQSKLMETQRLQNRAMAKWAPLRTTDYYVRPPVGVETLCPVCGNQMATITNGWRCNSCGEQR